MGEWLNDDGLQVLYGRDRLKRGLGGNSDGDGNLREITIRFDYSDLGELDKVVATRSILSEGVRVHSATLHVNDAFVGGGTLNVGLANVNGVEALDLDYLGSVAGSSLTSGATVELSGSGVGADVASKGKISLQHTGSVFTAGSATLKISAEVL